MRVCLSEDQLDLLRITFFQLLLQEATAMLVFAMSQDLALKVL